MSELADEMVEKYGKEIDPEYIRAIVNLKENNINQRFLTCDGPRKEEKKGMTFIQAIPGILKLIAYGLVVISAGYWVISEIASFIK